MQCLPLMPDPAGGGGGHVTLAWVPEGRLLLSKAEAGQILLVSQGLGWPGPWPHPWMGFPIFCQFLRSPWAGPTSGRWAAAPDTPPSSREVATAPR